MHKIVSYTLQCDTVRSMLGAYRSDDLPPQLL